MNALRLEELLIAWEDDALTPEELAELKHLLATEPLARRRLVAAGVLRGVAESQVRAWQTSSAGAHRQAAGFGWLSWRPLTAATAGVVFGLFSASVVWAYAAPRVAAMLEQAVPLTNGDFENAQEPATNGMPGLFGMWSGDFSRVAGAEQGVSPRHGQRMLRVLRSDSSVDAPGQDSRGGDLMQLVDLRPFKADFAAGNVVLEVSASANMITSGKDQFRFAVQVFAFSGQPQSLSNDPREVLQSALATSRQGFSLDDDPATWQPATARLLLSADADFAMVKLTVTQKEPRPPGHVDFAGHYVDDVKLVLTTQPSRPARAGKR